MIVLSDEQSQVLLYAAMYRMLLSNYFCKKRFFYNINDIAVPLSTSSTFDISVFTSAQMNVIWFTTGDIIKLDANALFNVVNSHVT